MLTGITYETLAQCKLWKCGPPWITNHEQWPKWNEAVTLTIKVDTSECIEDTESTVSPPVETSGLSLDHKHPQLQQPE